MSEKKPTLQTLVRIPKHKHYYLNPISKKITYRRMHKGESNTIRTGKTKIGEAVAFVEIELRKRATGETKSEAKRAIQGAVNPTVEDCFNDFYEVASVGKSANTKKNYMKAWNYALKGFWGDKNAADLIDAKQIDAFKKWYLETNPNRIFDQTNAIFRLFLRYLHDRGVIGAFPKLGALSDITDVVKTNKRYIKPGRVYTEEEEARLLSAWEAILVGRRGGKTDARRMIAARVRLGVMLGLKRGLRMKEICALLKSKIHWKKKTIEVWSFKNKRWRTLHLDQDLEEALKYQLEANADLKSDFLFPMPSDPSRHISNQVFEKAWYRVRKIAGIDVRHKYDARFHDCRKTCATRTAELGWPVKVACEMLDMSISVYEKVYASNVGVDAQAKWIAKTFGGGDAL